jgi:hypothetical protein
MRQLITGLVAAAAVMTASAVPAMACGGGLFQSSCSPCGYVDPCAQPQVYVPPAPTYSYSGCNTGCGGGWGYERLADPEEQYYAAPTRHQYYYVNQGPTYTGPGNFAPYPTYREGGISTWSGYRHHPRHYRYGAEVETPRYYGYRARPHFRAWREGYRHTMRPSVRYGYAPRNYAPRFYAQPRHSMRYGAPMGMPRMYGNRDRMMHEHMMRRD